MGYSDFQPGRRLMDWPDDVVDLATVLDLDTFAVLGSSGHAERDRNVPVVSGRYLAGALPNCRATFYAEDAHLSVPLNHQQEILSALQLPVERFP